MNSDKGAPKAEAGEVLIVDCCERENALEGFFF